MKTKVFFILLIMTILPALAGDTQSQKEKGRNIDSWLMLGPAPVTGLEQGAYESKRDIANHHYLPLSRINPRPGQIIRWSHDSVLTWTAIDRFETKTENDSIYYFVTYLDVNKFLKTGVNINGIHGSMVDLFLNGQSLKKHYDQKKGEVRTDLTLLNQKHTLLIKVLVPGGESFTLDVRAEDPKLIDNGMITFSNSPVRRVDFSNILNMKQVSGLTISPDGSAVAVSLAKTDQKGETTRWTEIMKISDGYIMVNTDGQGDYSNLTWLKDSTSFLYTQENKKVTTIYKYDLIKHERESVKNDIKDFDGFELSPDNSFILLWTSQKKDYGKGFKYIETIPDRSAYGTSNYTIYLNYLQGQVDHKISNISGQLSGVMISPDNKKVLLTVVIPDTQNRPYFKSVFKLLDLTNYRISELFQSNLVYPASWSPDSNQILFTGGPSSFQGIGNILPDDVIPNEYDTQMFIYSVSSKKARPITRNFSPSVESVSWNLRDGNIYLRATDRSFVKLYRYEIKKERFVEIPTPVDTVRRVDFASRGKTAVFWGSGAVDPDKLYWVDLFRKRTFLLKDFNREHFLDVRLGKLENWDYLTPEGKKIMGRIHFPVDFNPEKKYPCIVYYYGGTSPVERSFGGRYPFNWYAANGYIVYVLQPSGSVGFGQAFSAIHVNDWGKTTSKEIIWATRELTDKKKYIDRERLGAMGASYGGFLTQYLASQTDMFAAFISHAGISALSSYWGVGDWGYTYSGVATAGSFPWNRRDIYVDHSPLFLADKITTPLLLLHGDRDNNVPPGESYQMFAALKLLGKEVALVTISDQSHWIMKYEKRLHWMKTIMAWFDKWLKGEPLYWDHLYSQYSTQKEKK